MSLSAQPVHPCLTCLRCHQAVLDSQEDRHPDTPRPPQNIHRQAQDMRVALATLQPVLVTLPRVLGIRPRVRDTVQHLQVIHRHRRTTVLRLQITARHPPITVQLRPGIARPVPATLLQALGILQAVPATHLRHPITPPATLVTPQRRLSTPQHHRTIRRLPATVQRALPTRRHHPALLISRQLIRPHHQTIPPRVPAIPQRHLHTRRCHRPILQLHHRTHQLPHLTRLRVPVTARQPLNIPRHLQVTRPPPPVTVRRHRRTARERTETQAEAAEVTIPHQVLDTRRLLQIIPQRVRSTRPQAQLTARSPRQLLAIPRLRPTIRHQHRRILPRLPIIRRNPRRTHLHRLNTHRQRRSTVQAHLNIHRPVRVTRPQVQLLFRPSHRHMRRLQEVQAPRDRQETYNGTRRPVRSIHHNRQSAPSRHQEVVNTTHHQLRHIHPFRPDTHPRVLATPRTRLTTPRLLPLDRVLMIVHLINRSTAIKMYGRRLIKEVQRLDTVQVIRSTVRQTLKVPVATKRKRN